MTPKTPTLLLVALLIPGIALADYDYDLVDADMEDFFDDFSMESSDRNVLSSGNNFDDDFDDTDEPDWDEGTGSLGSFDEPSDEPDWDTEPGVLGSFDEPMDDEWNEDSDDFGSLDEFEDDRGSVNDSNELGSFSDPFAGEDEFIVTQSERSDSSVELELEDDELTGLPEENHGDDQTSGSSNDMDLSIFVYEE